MSLNTLSHFVRKGIIRNARIVPKALAMLCRKIYYSTQPITLNNHHEVDGQDPAYHCAFVPESYQWVRKNILIHALITFAIVGGSV